MLWLDDEDEELLELYELLTEARKDIDKKYPRIEDRQAQLIVNKIDLQQWIRTHYLMFDLENYFKDLQ